MTHPAANRNVNAVPLHIVCVKVFMDLPRSLLRLVHAEQESFLLVRKLLLLTQFLFLFLQVLCFCATAFDSAQKCFSHDPLQGLLHVIKHDLKTVVSFLQCFQTVSVKIRVQIYVLMEATLPL